MEVDRASRALPRKTLLCVMALLLVTGACSRQPSTQSTTDLDQQSRWSGPWALSDDSFQKGAIPDTGYGGFGSDAGRVPLHPKYLAIRDENGKRRAEGGAAAGNLPKCLPAGMPGMLQHPLMFEVLFTPGRVTFIFEDGEIRRIHVDGRQHPAAGELQPSFSGDSIGHWEGQTLVVDTVGIDRRADVFMSSELRPGPSMHIVERMTLESQDTMRIDTTVTDEELFAAPYRYSRTYTRSTLPMLNASCVANNRDSDAEVNLTPPTQ